MLKKILSIFIKPVIDPIPELLEEINTLVAGTQFAEAEAMCRKKLTEYPYQPDLLCALGMSLGAQGKLDNAVLCFSQVLKQTPKHPDCLKGLGNIAFLREEYAAAADYYEHFLDTFPYVEDILVNYSKACEYIGSYERAKPVIQNWVKAFPYNIAAHSAIASIYHNLNKHQDCFSHIHEILDIEPKNNFALYMRSYLHMFNHRFTEAWRDYESRIKLTWGNNLPPFKRWNGQRLDKELLIVRLEQGMGDNIMFARFLPALNALASHIIVITPESLLEVFSDSFANIKFLIDQANIQQAEQSEMYWLPLLSAPFELGLKGISDLSMQHSYIKPNTSKTKIIQSILGEKKKPRVGIIWRGNKARKDYKLRAIAEDELNRLITSDDSMNQIEWISLQNDEQPPPLLASKIRDLSEYLVNFSDTAALINELDAVISIDTSVAHLAGAMGISTYVLEPYTNDWRWRIGQHESPWYPTTKLYKSELPDSPEPWDKAINKIKNDLCQQLF